MKHYTLFFLLFLTLFFFYCNNDVRKVPKEVIESPLSLSFKRFEIDLMYLKGDTIKAIKTLSKTYPDFFYLWTNRIINIGDSANPQLKNTLQDFLHDKNINDMYNDVQTVFPDFNSYQGQLTNVFKAYHYYFPKKNIPEIITFVSGFNLANVTTQKTLGIGLELYLGNEYKPYTLMGIENYRKNVMCKEYIVSDAMQAWVSTEFENDKDNANVLAQMIYKGKILYAMDELLTETNDTIKIGYTNKQMKWCHDNERKIWAYFIEKKLLYAPMRGENTKYFNEGPFTSGFPRESPAKIGTWIGWQIVKAYMKNNTTVTLPQLFNEQEAQLILTKSKYKPK